MFSNGKRPPFHLALVFMILVTQNLNDLYDERTEYLINDGLSFTRFPDLKPSDRGAGFKTVCLLSRGLEIESNHAGTMKTFYCSCATYLPEN